MDLEQELLQEGIDPGLLREAAAFRKAHPAGEMRDRIPAPRFLYYGKEVWEEAAAALLCGENLLLAGPKATGKNVLAENLATLFGRPCWNISLSIQADSSELIGTDTFRDNRVSFRPGPVAECARCGGFGILDEINMARNETLAVLHATLDFRRVIDVPGYDRIVLDEATRFIATMNYGYAGTRDLNEALTSRFAVIEMPPVEQDALCRLMKREFPDIRDRWAGQLADLFKELENKCESAEISSKSLDLRGLLSAVRLMKKGIGADAALRMGIANKSFDPFERQLVMDTIRARIPKSIRPEEIFGP
ncbi:MAG TPA: MoxR family ATPase [Candidatus Eisenbergiella merdigallinarum]|uniref:MoxR family ATPase n=1 Tax=Candidatus Eisenbergiella merdigallinarum TaxID=2838552 RepID=A0A9D2SCG5_9FIRM|nr:MoxR family ATPase [Candidatus Eisenbergiella merdigallinarum]